MPFCDTEATKTLILIRTQPCELGAPATGNVQCFTTLQQRSMRQTLHAQKRQTSHLGKKQCEGTVCRSSKQQCTRRSAVSLVCNNKARKYDDSHAQCGTEPSNSHIWIRTHLRCVTPRQRAKSKEEKRTRGHGFLLTVCKSYVRSRAAMTRRSEPHTRARKHGRI